MLPGDEHKRRRAVLHKHMAKGNVERYLPQMCAEIRAVGAKLAKSGTFDPHEFTAALALRTICIAVFGSQVISHGDEEALVQAVGMIEDDLADDMFRVAPIGPVGWLRRRRRRAFAKLAMSTVVERLRSGAGKTSALKDMEDLGIDRSEDGPIDILVQDRSKLIGSAFAERAMKFARETPEAMLCHLLTPNCL